MIFKCSNVWAQDWGYHPVFFLIYTNLTISEKSPLWKVFSSHNFLYIIGYNILQTLHDPHDLHDSLSQNLGVATPNPRIDAYVQDTPSFQTTTNDIQRCRRKLRSTGTLLENNKYRNAVQACLWGHLFMTTIRKLGFWPPPRTHVNTPKPRGRSQAADIKYTLLSVNC